MPNKEKNSKKKQQYFEAARENKVWQSGFQAVFSSSTSSCNQANQIKTRSGRWTHHGVSENSQCRNWYQQLLFLRSSLELKKSWWSASVLAGTVPLEAPQKQVKTYYRSLPISPWLWKYKRTASRRTITSAFWPNAKHFWSPVVFKAKLQKKFCNISWRILGGTVSPLSVGVHSQRHTSPRMPGRHHTSVVWTSSSHASWEISTTLWGTIFFARGYSSRAYYTIPCLASGQQTWSSPNSTCHSLLS